MNDVHLESTGLTRRELLVLTAGAMWVPLLRAAPAAGNAWAPLDALCKKTLADHVAPGLAVSVMRAGQMLYSSGFGFANLETGTPVTPHSVFHIGSITKQFTAASIALLAEAGKLGFDDKLSRFLPDFPHADDIRLRQMLTHTSGLGNYTDTDTRQLFMQAARVDYDDHALFVAMRGTSPLFVARPGTTWEYSNTAYVLLGMVVEKQSGMPYGKFFRERLLEPAGLASTAVDDAATVVPGRATGYTPDKDAASGYDNASFISMTFPGAAGSMRSTTEDLCRWHHALLGGRIVKPESLKEMMTPGRLKDGTLPLAKMDPEKDEPAKPMEYGFGLALGDLDGKRWVGHAGGINGFSSQVRSFPAQQVSVATLVNSDFGGNATAYQATEGVRDAAARIALGLA